MIKQSLKGLNRLDFLFHLDSFGEYIDGGEIDMSDFLQTSPLSCSLDHLEDYYSKKNENVLHIETSKTGNYLLSSSITALNLTKNVSNCSLVAFFDISKSSSEKERRAL